MSAVEIRTLNSPGPISDRFLMSRAFVSVIIGPVGSAKTMTALRKLKRAALMQRGVKDGKGRIRRRARVGVIRETYPSLERNTLPSWFRIHPPADGEFSRKAPYSHKIILILASDPVTGDASDYCEFEIEFRAIGDQGVEAACRGWEINAVMIDEADLQPSDLLAFLSGRVGRFSDLDPALVVDPQIILSLNAPYIDNWVYKLAVDKELGELMDPAVLAALGGRPLIETFIQPGGLEPDAENIHNLPGATPENPKGGRNYYVIQAAVNKHKPGYVDRMIHNKFVPMQFGMPVYPDFNFAEHVRDDLEWDKSRKLFLGVDNGVFTAAVAQQHDDFGNIRDLAEVVNYAEDGKSLAKIGPTAMGLRCKRMLAELFPGIRADQIRVVADPAAFVAEDRQDSELDWIRAFEAALGFKVHRARSNRAQLRLEAIRKPMSRRGGYAVHRRCRHLIRGLLGGYRYADAQMSGGEVRGHIEIKDTIYTHVCDADQYAALESQLIVDDVRGKSGPSRARAREAGGRVDFGGGYFSGRR